MQKTKDKRHTVQKKTIKRKPSQFSENKYNSRKLFITLSVLIMSFTIIVFKFNDSIFLELFKQWSWLALGVFAIYTGGNIGQKFSRRNRNINNQDNDYQQQDPEYNHQDEDGA